jgi:hypothetical protein
LNENIVKTPFYTWPHRTKKARIEYLAAHESYGGWNHPARRWSPLAWNVKIHRADLTGKCGDYEVSDLRDEAWNEYAQTSGSLWTMIVEDMQRMYLEGEYSTYPGDDQGDWEFTFAGRSGGWMLLKESKWSFADAGEWRDWLLEQDKETIEKLYRAVRCMDADFTSEKISREFEYQVNFQRSQWEETQPPLEPCIEAIYESRKHAHI